jgi:hypothetical protein
MSSRRPTGTPRDVPHDTISRRRLLAVGGVVGVGSVAGCLNRVASAVTNTGASPGAVFAGPSDARSDDDTDSSFGQSLSEPRVTRLTPTLSGGSGLVSGEVELEAWVTSVAVSAANYNNSRSNRSTIRAVNILGDDLDESDESFEVALDLEARLQAETEAAVASISKRSARTGRNPETGREITSDLGDMDGTLSELRSVLERCPDESCVAALKNVGRMEEAVRQARNHVENEEWESAIEVLGGDNTSPIYEGDAVGGESAIHRGAIAPPNGPLAAEEREDLVEYFDGEPIIGERFTVCVPDAEVPGGNGSISGEVTPQRLVDYLTGRSDGAGRVYSWGDADSDGDGLGDCDDEDGDVRPGTLCGTTPHFVADISGPIATGGSLEVARESDGMVTIINTPPETDGGPATVCAAVSDDDPCGPGVWARTTRSGSTPGTLVYQVLVQPPECPHPFPALLYTQRCRSDDQLVYTGGWVIDEAALYAGSLTVLSMTTETQVVPVGLGDVDGDGLGDLVERSVSGPRALRGARIDSGTVGALVESGVLSSGGAEGIRKPPGRRTYGDIVLKHVAVDAPVLHLVGAARASRDVKFKAGAELSKSVN